VDIQRIKFIFEISTTIFKFFFGRLFSSRFKNSKVLLIFCNYYRNDSVNNAFKVQFDEQTGLMLTEDDFDFFDGGFEYYRLLVSIVDDFVDAFITSRDDQSSVIELDLDMVDFS
jgi:hypothetical protein